VTADCAPPIGTSSRGRGRVGRQRKPGARGQRAGQSSISSVAATCRGRRPPATCYTRPPMTGRLCPTQPGHHPSVGHPIHAQTMLDQFGGRLGRAWRETDEENTDYETLIRHLPEGQCNNPVRVVAFNTDEGWSRDVSDDVADELRDRCASAERCQTFFSTFLRPLIPAGRSNCRYRSPFQSQFRMHAPI
jgi:hypothetical protein